MRRICEYLTFYSGAVCFVRDRNAKLKKGQLEESPETVYTDFRHLLRNTKMQIESDEQLFRSYKRKADLERAKRKLLSCIATVSMLLAKNVDFETTFSKDAVDVLASVNDNDAVKSFKLSSENGEEVILRNMKYDQIRDRRKHTLKNVVEVPEEENPGEV